MKLVLFFFIFLSITLAIGFLVNKSVSSPYMDEIFHIPQAQRYCELDSTWDPKITTLPGLYVVSLLYAFLLKTFYWHDLDVCDVVMLRSINIGFLLMTFLVVFLMITQINDRKPLGNRLNDWMIHVKSLRISLFPLLYFFTFLYYTDVGSTFFILLSYFLAECGLLKTSALISIVSVLFRQTNIVWSFYVPARLILLHYSRQRDFLMVYVKKNVVSMSLEYLPFILLGVSFVFFVKINGGVVVGDRDNHTASIHFPQICYFAAFSTIFLSGNVLLSIWKEPAKYMKYFKNKFVWLLVLLIPCSLIGYYFTQVHPFILADNRHYPFYIWRKLFFIIKGREVAGLVNALYTPFYMVCFLLLWRLDQRVSLVKGLFWFCVAMNLLPMPVVEFRYFVVPFIFLAMGVDNLEPWGEIVNMFLNISVNFVTLYIFVYRPFDDGESRFMW